MIEQLVLQMCARLAPSALSGATAVLKSAKVKKDREVAQALAEVSLQRIRLSVVSDLAARGVRDADAERVMDVFRSDAGVEAVRQIVIYNLAIAANRDSEGSLNRSIQLLLALEAGEELDHHKYAAEILTGTLNSTMYALRARMERSPSGRELLRDLQDEARHRRLETALLGEASVNNRAPRLASLISSGAHIDADDEKQYANTLLAETSEITVPTLSAKQVSVPFDEGYVMPTLTFLEEEDGIKSASLYEYINRRRNVVVLGDPGAGKSTGLRYLARSFVADYYEYPHRPLPFLVTLRHFAQARKADSQLGFIQFISNNLRDEYHATIDRDSLIYLLHVGRAAILFDGLDEILDFDLRKQIALSIATIAHAFPSSIFVTSAREVGYDQNPIPRFNHRSWVGPFDEAGITKFIDTYLAASNGQVDLSSEKFLKETSGIADLRKNPLLLGVLCSLYSSGRTMPNNRAQLYEKCGEMIFDAWDTQKSLAVPFEHKQLAEDAVCALALDTFKSGQEEIAESELRNFLEQFYNENLSRSRAAGSKFASDTLDRWKGRMWVLVYLGEKEGVDIFRFAHRSFLEFFAAQQTVYESEDDTALWIELSALLEERVAISYALLCIELFGVRSRGALDNFYREATIRISELRNSGRALEGLNLATSIFEALACTRGNTAPRRAVMIESIHAFAQAIPRLRLSDPNHVSLLRDGIGYTELFDVSIGERFRPDWDEVEDLQQLGQYSVGSITIQGAASMFRSLSRLRNVDREGAIDALESTVHLIRKDDVELALRLTMTMQQVPAFETWADIGGDLRPDLYNVASELWFDLIENLSSAVILEIDDVWLRIALLRSGKPGWGELKGRTDICSFFESGWPFPIDSSSVVLPKYGPSVHLVVLAFLGLTDAGSIGHILASESERADFANAFTLRDQEFCFNVEESHTPGFIFGYNTDLERADRIQTTDLQLWVAICLLIALDRLGDRVFIESVVEAMRGSSALERMIELQDRVCYRESARMFPGHGPEIELRTEAQVTECLTLLNTISDLAGFSL